MDFQYQVPQFIDIEDKIIGPLTLKQFFFLVGGIAITLLVFFTLRFIFALLIGLPALTLAGAFAFIKVDGLPFSNYVSSMINFAFKPQKYLWKKK